jgi:hypothetical protein
VAEAQGLAHCFTTAAANAVRVCAIVLQVSLQHTRRHIPSHLFGPPLLPVTWLLQVTSYALAKQLSAVVVGGPTAQEQPPFQWDPAFSEYAHRGMPNR